MNKKYILFASIGFLALILVFLLFQPNSDSTSSAEDQTNTSRDNFSKGINVFSGGVSSGLDLIMLEKSKEIFMEDGTWLPENEIFKSAYRGELDLVSELWALRRQCPKDYNDYQCQNLIRTFLIEKYGEGKLLQLFDKYSKFERSLAELKPPETDDPMERYRWIKDQRRKSFTDDEIRLVFGLEETLAEYSNQREEFLERTKNLTGDNRIKEYEKFRKRQLGDYYDAVSKREPTFQRFDRELELRSDEMSRMDPVKREQMEREVRLKYFDKEANERMEKVLEDIKKEENLIQLVREEEKNFIKNNPNLKGEKLEEALMKIRTKHMGVDLAEEYSRRLQAEKASSQ